MHEGMNQYQHTTNFRSDRELVRLPLKAEDWQLQTRYKKSLRNQKVPQAMSWVDKWKSTHLHLTNPVHGVQNCVNRGLDRIGRTASPPDNLLVRLNLDRDFP